MPEYTIYLGADHRGFAKKEELFPLLCGCHENVNVEDLGVVTLSENAKIVLAQRYQKTDPATGEKESVEGMFWRVAKAIASSEENYPTSPWKAEDLALRFYELMAEGIFLPNSPTLMNAGLPLGQLAACFVLPVGDSI